MNYFLLLFSLFGLFSKDLSPKQKSAQITQKFALEFQKEHQFDDAMQSYTKLGRRVLPCHSALFIGHQQLRLQEVQQVAQKCVRGLRERLLVNTEDIDCFGENLIWALSVRMSFWDKEWDRMMPPYIAEVRAHHGKIYYYQADPKTQQIQLIHEEPYDFLKEVGLAPVDPWIYPRGEKQAPKDHTVK
jgi:hypothetical protein